MAAGFRVTLADPPAPGRGVFTRRGGSANRPAPDRPKRDDHAELLRSSVGARAPGPGPVRPWLLQPLHRFRCPLPVAQHGPHPRPERAGQAGRRPGAGRRPRWPCARGWFAQGLDRPGRPVPNLEVVDVRGCRSARSSQLPQGRRRRRGRAGARLALLALAPRRRPGRHPGGARGPAGPAAGRAGRCGHPAHRPHPDLAGTGLWANRCRTGGCTRGGWSAWAATGPMTRTVAVLTWRAGRRRPAAPDRGPHRPPAAGGVLRVPGRGGGGGRLDHRAAAMVQGASGEGGGILCTYEADGRRRLPRAHRRGPAVRLRPPPRHRPRRPAPPPGPGGGRRAGPGADPAAAAASGCASPSPAATGRRCRRPPRRGRRRPDRMGLRSCRRQGRPTAGPATGSPASAPPGPRWPGGRSGPRGPSAPPASTGRR